MTLSSPVAGRAAPRLRAMAAALAMGALLPAWRCTPSVAPRGPPRSYVARGEVLQMPRADRRRSEMTVRHEAVDDFMDEYGLIVGMDAMEMSFPVEPPLTAKDLAVGDKVSFRFTVDWDKSTYKVDQLDKLPADAALQYRPAQPRRPTAPDAG